MTNFLRWGFFISASIIVITLIEYFGGLGESHDIIKWISLGVALGLLFKGIFEKKKEDPGGFTFGKGWIEGILISLIAGVIVSIFLYFYFDLINPQIMDFSRSEATRSMAAQNMPKEKMEQAKKTVDFIISPAGFAISTFFAYSIGGMILSLIFTPIIKSIRGNSVLQEKA